MLLVTKIRFSTKAFIIGLSLWSGLAQTAVASEEAVLLSPELARARTHFRRHEYREALLALTSLEDEQSLSIAAESRFRLGEYAKAKEYFTKLSAMVTDPSEQKKLAIRLFEVDLLSDDINGALAAYEKYKEKYAPTAMMSYGLGKAFYDRGDALKAKVLLESVAIGNEFYLRARYILASLDIGHKNTSELVELFKAIEDGPMVSVEDHAVHDLAILAQGRILLDAGLEDLADMAYERILPSSKYFATATYELASNRVTRSEQARLGLGPFKEVKEVIRKEEQENNLTKALKAIERYRKFKEIGWLTPQLLALVGDLMVKSKRYDDARIAYADLFDHYQSVRDKLLKTEELWPEFALFGFRPDPGIAIVGLPEELFASHQVKDLLLLKNRLEESHIELLRLEQLENERIKSPSLVKAKTKQQELEDSFRSIALDLQKELSKKLITLLDEHLAQAKFDRTKIIQAEVQGMRKQLSAVQEFQTKSIQRFESSLEALDKGGAQ